MAVIACKQQAQRDPDPQGLAELRWLTLDADALKALGTAPTECLVNPDDKHTAALILIGRTAFASPLLLGGQAAKSGMSCQTCHSNGHSNKNFFLDGLSDAPGTADVTSSIFSTSRGDGVFNPKPIPSLSDKNAHTRTRDPASPELADFLHGLIEEEFAGFEPEPLIFDSVLSYLRALDNTACDSPIPVRPQSLERALERMDSATRAIEYAMLLDNQTQSTQFLLAAAQVQIGRISARYNKPVHARIRRDLASASENLRVLRENIPDAHADRALQKWREEWTGIQKRLRAQEHASLFDLSQLQNYLQDEP